MEAINKNTVAEINVTYKPTVSYTERPKVYSGTDALKYIKEGFNENTIMMQEQFVVMYLDQANGVLGVYKAAIGGITSTVVDIRIILSVGLKLLATKMIIAHNHPSGNLKPSRADTEITTKLRNAADFMDIKLIDHLIISSSGHLSFAEEGIL